MSNVDEHKTGSAENTIGTSNIARYNLKTVLSSFCGDDGGGDGSQNVGGDDGGGNNGKVDLTPEQQVHIDRTFNAKFAEIQDKAEAKAKTEINDLKNQITVLKEEASNKVKSDDKGNNDVKAMQERLDKMEARNRKSIETGITGALESVSTGLNAVNPSQVAVLVRSFIKTDEDGKISVVNQEGQAMFNGEGQPMTIKEFLTDFLKKSPHLVKANGSKGAGSQGAGPGNTATNVITRAAYEALEPAKQSEFIKKGGTLTDG